MIKNQLLSKKGVKRVEFELFIEVEDRKKDTVCSVCGTSFSDFESSGFLGCPHCYVEFRDRLVPFISRTQLNFHHQGKYPVHSVSEGRMRKKLTLLKKELREEVRKENFERAAVLRDEINLIQESMKEGEK